MLALYKEARQAAQLHCGLVFNTTSLVLMRYGFIQHAHTHMNLYLSGTGAYQSRYTFDALFQYTQHCLTVLETLLALEVQRLLRIDMVQDVSSVIKAGHLQLLKMYCVRVFYLLTQKLQPFLQRFYHNRYMLFRVRALEIQYDHLLILLKRFDVDQDWVLNTFCFDKVELQKKADDLLNNHYIMSSMDAIALMVERVKVALCYRIDGVTLLQKCHLLRNTFVLKRTLQTASIEEADHYFTFGTIAYALPASMNEYYMYYREAQLLYQECAPTHPRLMLCSLLSRCEVTDRDDLDLYRELCQCSIEPVHTASDEHVVQTCLKAMAVVQKASVEEQPWIRQDTLDSVFTFEHLKDIDVFRTACQVSCPHGV